MKNILKLFLFIIGCELVGILATPFTVSSIPTWYAELIKPSFSPPNWVFGPVWVVLYLLMGVSVYLIWKEGTKKKRVKIALFYFLIQLFFNFLWSAVFFGLHQPLLAFVDIILLFGAIILTMVKFNKISKVAFYLLIPYLVWVSFATILNVSIVFLNK